MPGPQATNESLAPQEEQESGNRAEKPLADLQVAPAVLAQQLDGRGAPQHGVTGAVDGAHAAPAAGHGGGH